METQFAFVHPTQFTICFCVLVLGVAWMWHCFTRND